MLKIYGASDDLLEIEGDIREEFEAYSAKTLVLSNGTQIRAEYCPGDYPGWKIEVIKAGENISFTRIPCPKDDEENYSDVIEIMGKIEWVECWDHYPPSSNELAERLQMVIEDTDFRQSDPKKLLEVYHLLTRK